MAGQDEVCKMCNNTGVVPCSDDPCSDDSVSCPGCGGYGYTTGMWGIEIEQDETEHFVPDGDCDESPQGNERKLSDLLKS